MKRRLPYLTPLFTILIPVLLGSCSARNAHISRIDSLKVQDSTYRDLSKLTIHRVRYENAKIKGGLLVAPFHRIGIPFVFADKKVAVSVSYSPTGLLVVKALEKPFTIRERVDETVTRQNNIKVETHYEAHLKEKSKASTREGVTNKQIALIAIALASVIIILSLYYYPRQKRGIEENP